MPLFGPTLGPNGELVSLFRLNLRPISRPCAVFWVQIWAYIGNLCHPFGSSLDAFRELVSMCGSKNGLSGACITSLGPNSGGCPTFRAQIWANFARSCHFLGLNVGPFRDTLSFFGHKYGSLSGACVTFCSQILAQIWSLCHFLGQNLGLFRELVSLFGHKSWPISATCVTFLVQIWPHFGRLCHFFGPNLGPIGELVSLFGPKFEPISELMSLFGPKFGHNPPACVNFGPKFWPKSGACLTFWAQIWAPFTSLCHFLGPYLRPIRELMS